MKNLNKLYPHFLAILGFVVVSLIYFYPVLQGKKIYQSDIAQYTGMAKELNDYRKATGEEAYWTNSAFGGMPTYQLGAHYPHNYIKDLDLVIRFLPRPADYLFLYFIGFYILLRVLKTDPLKAFFGALAFGLSTYLVIILGVGHNAKAHAIAYMPVVVAGVILVFQRRYLLGGLLTLIAAALEINANHFQMTYYLLLLLIIIGIFFIVRIVKSKDFKHLWISVGVFGVAGVLALGMNATNLMATAEYADFSTRSNSELTFNPDGSPKESTNAMTYDYITEYSYGPAESFNLIVPRFMGGSSGNEQFPEESHLVEYLQTMQIGEGQYLSQAQALEIASGMPTYWGEQPIVAAPAYIGAIVFFFFVLAMFVEDRKIKWAFLAGAIVSLLLSWGKHFPLLTDFFIDYFPMYNKFRAVASIQVILELCLPVLAVMGFYTFFKLDKDRQWKALWQTAAVTLGLLLLLQLIKGSFSFAGPHDQLIAQSYGQGFVDALEEDRKDFYSADLLRSGMLILAVAVVLWLYTRQKLKQSTAVVLAGIIMVFDLFFIDKKYVNESDFRSASQIDKPFEPTMADEQIQQDTAHYRVFNVNENLNGASTSYFHKSIGGYHAAKPRKLQQLFEYQIANNNIGVLNMLNVRYVIQDTETGESVPTYNPDANGNAWFVSRVKTVDSPDEAMRALDKLDFKREAVINKAKFPNAVTQPVYRVDSTATITLESYKPDYLKYTSNNSQDGMALFSEMYYAHGWNAYIDGKQVPHFEANYAIRGLKVPAGKHVIEFRFEPQVVKTGSTIALISTLVVLLLIAAGIYYWRKERSGESIA